MTENFRTSALKGAILEKDNRVLDWPGALKGAIFREGNHHFRALKGAIFVETL